MTFKKGGQLVYVGAADVALVGAGVDCEAMGSGLNADFAHFDDAGNGERAGVAEESNFVEVDAEVGHFYRKRGEEREKERRKSFR